MKKVGVIVSLVAGLGSLGLGHLYFRRLEAEVSGGPKVSVLVAAKDIPVGTPLTEALVAVRDIPSAYIESRHVRASELKKVLGARVAGGLRANEAVQWSDLTKFNEHARVLSGLVQQGMRALAIDARSADFDGLLRPGDRVDVLFTKGEKSDGGGATSTLLQNLLVLSVGGNIARADDDDASRGRGRSVTLSVTVEQAQLLTQAEQRGRLSLTLRNSEDIKIVEALPETAGNTLTLAANKPSDAPVVKATKGSIEHVR